LSDRRIRIALFMFDLDGTLADTARDIVAAINFARVRLGLARLPRSTVQVHIGRGVEHLIARCFPGDATLRRKAAELFLEHYRAHLLDHTRLYPRVEEALRRLGGKKKAVVSNKLRALSVAILEGLGIASHFDLVLGGDSTPRRKPDPEPLRRAMETLRVEPAEALMIGDDAGDIEAGRAAGVRTCAVTYGIGDRERLLRAKPDFVIDDLLELEDHCA
jgi:phosphoglycolate phosphatase